MKSEYKEIIKYILVFIIGFRVYRNTTVTLASTDNIILTQIVKLAFVILVTYIFTKGVIALADFIYRFMK